MYRFHRKYAVRDAVALILCTLLRKLLIFDEMHGRTVLCLCLRLQCLWFWKRAFIVICDFCVYILRFLVLWLLVCVCTVVCVYCCCTVLCK